MQVVNELNEQLKKSDKRLEESNVRYAKMELDKQSENFQLMLEASMISNINLQQGILFITLFNAFVHD